MKIDIHDSLMEAAPTLYTVVGVYILLGLVWLFIGWLLLQRLGESVRNRSDAYDEFVRHYLSNRGMFFRLQSRWLIAIIASGVLHRSFWGRAFRNLEPEEAERIATSFPVSTFERWFSRFMLIHTWIVSMGLLIGCLLEAISWILNRVFMIT
ncbi:MAG: hypothetical protein JJU06_09255 [Ectothiorhodospiraceae bacterium]|nr:hypothetical protein [Ectothiorhodospiraceae bacterium]